MPMVGTGNPKGAKPDKLIRDALKAALRQDPKHLKQIAEAWVERAKTDQASASALADRIDGKAMQEVTGEGGGDIRLTINKIVHSARDID